MGEGREASASGAAAGKSTRVEWDQEPRAGLQRDHFLGTGVSLPQSGNSTTLGFCLCLSGQKRIWGS